MSKRQWLCILGIWIAAFLFLGFPTSWDKIISLISGLIIVLISYNLPQEEKNISSDNSVFVDSEKKN